MGVCENFKNKANLVSNRGSITVEAAFIVPIIIISIIAIVYIGFIFYQRSLLQSAVDKAAICGADNWENISSDISTGKLNYSGLDVPKLYWRLFDTESSYKKERIKEFLESLLKKNCILKPIYSTVTVEMRDFIIYKKLEINVENSYYFPGGALLGIFGQNGSFGVKVKSFAIIDEPSEMIRTTDLILDIEKELENKYPGVKNIGEKTRGVLEKIKSNMELFTK